MEKFGVLLNWLLFFSLVSFFFLPALMFRKIALYHNKKGWPFLLLGLAVGYITLQLGLVLLHILLPYVIHSEGFRAIIMIVFNYAIIFLAVFYFRRYMQRRNS